MKVRSSPLSVYLILSMCWDFVRSLRLDHCTCATSVVDPFVPLENPLITHRHREPGRTPKVRRYTCQVSYDLTGRSVYRQRGEQTKSRDLSLSMSALCSSSLTASPVRVDNSVLLVPHLWTRRTGDSLSSFRVRCVKQVSTRMELLCINN